MYVSVCVCLHLCLYVSMCMSVSLCISAPLSVCVPMYVCVRVCVCASMSLCPCVCLSLCLYVSLCMSMSLYVCACVCTSVPLCLCVFLWVCVQNANSYLSWIDVSCGKQVSGFTTALGRLDVMCQNAATGVVHLGHSGGVCDCSCLPAWLIITVKNQKAPRECKADELRGV